MKKITSCSGNRSAACQNGTIDIRLSALTGDLRQMDADMNRVVNGYEFLEPVGAGGFGVVYRAHQAAVGREVAIKVIQPQYANQPEFARRFEQEARLIARLEHPHIGRSTYWQSRRAFLVMRWPHRRAQQTPDEGALPVAAADDLLVSGRALHVHTAARHPPRHKPDNLLLDAEGNTYLADFGLRSVDIARSREGQIVARWPTRARTDRCARVTLSRTFTAGASALRAADRLHHTTGATSETCLSPTQ